MNRGGSRKPRRVPRDWRYPDKSYAELVLSQQNQQPRHQFITKEPDINFMDEEPVEGVSLVTDSQLVREMQVLLGNYVGARIFEHRFLPALYAVPLSMENIHQLQSKPHFMTPKPSGPRFLLYIDSSGQIYLENMTQHFFRVDTDRAVQFISIEGRAITDTVLDGIFTREKDAENNAGKLTFVICDAVRCNGQDITKMNVFQRIAFVKRQLGKQLNSKTAPPQLLKALQDSMTKSVGTRKIGKAHWL